MGATKCIAPLTHHIMTTSVTLASMDDKTTHINYYIIEGHVDIVDRSLQV